LKQIEGKFTFMMKTSTENLKLSQIVKSQIRCLLREAATSLVLNFLWWRIDATSAVKRLRQINDINISKANNKDTLMCSLANIV